MSWLITIGAQNSPLFSALSCNSSVATAVDVDVRPVAHVPRRRVDQGVQRGFHVPGVALEGDQVALALREDGAAGHDHASAMRLWEDGLQLAEFPCFFLEP